MADDRRQHAVDVEQDGGAARLGAQRGQRVVEGRGGTHATYDRRMPPPDPTTRGGTQTGLARPAPATRGGTQRVLRLAVIGTAAGLFSGLFGVGGGTVVVPLLILWLG